MDHSFGGGEPFTVGIEEELLLVDPPGHGLAHDAERVLAAMDAGGPWEADHEVFSAELELRSLPEELPSEAAEAVAAARSEARRAGATLIGAGLHPAAERGDVQLVDAPRYQEVEGSMRGLIKRTPECAIHIHVGMPDQESAVRAYNGLREWLPVLQALAANSPFWYGEDSGMASARAAVVRAYPGRGIPRPVRDLDEYAAALDATARGGGPEDYTYVWWDLRLHPRLGTVEVRELDAQSRLADARAIAALVQGLARHTAHAEVGAHAPNEALSWSAWRAARDGLDASLLADGRLVPAREAARAAVAAARPHSPEPAAFDGIERLLTEGNGADRQRRAHARGGMSGLLRELVEETAAAV
jgi:carboxylate-amine ligase